MEREHKEYARLPQDALLHPAEIFIDQALPSKQNNDRHGCVNSMLYDDVARLSQRTGRRAFLWISLSSG